MKLRHYLAISVVLVVAIAFAVPGMISSNKTADSSSNVPSVQKLEHNLQYAIRVCESRLDDCGYQVELTAEATASTIRSFRQDPCATVLQGQPQVTCTNGPKGKYATLDELP